MAGSNPRRRPRHVNTTPLAPPSSPAEVLSASPSPTGMTMILHKGATFHAPSTPPAELTGPVFAPPSLPRRSLTDLMVVDENAVPRSHITAALGSFERDLSENGLTGSRRLHTPVGQFSFSAEKSRQGTMTGQTAVIDINECIDPRLSAVGGLHDGTSLHGRRDRQRVKHHPSDSGIGSTVSGTILTSNHEAASHQSPKIHSSGLVSGSGGVDPPPRAPLSTTKSRSLIPPVLGETLHGISSDGMRHIEDGILQPLSSQQSLKDFHPLIRDVVHQINMKQILCLRDLEKALVYLAPARAKSPDTYLSFCDAWIHCFQTTVGHLSEQDQRRHADAPYTDGYFLDLVAQVRNYAREMAASRNRQAAGEPAQEMDYSPSERVVLDGGLSQTGRPAQLVREKGGKSIPIGPGSSAKEAHSQVYKDGRVPPLMKRALSEQFEEDSVHRSMARKRKLGPGETASPAPLHKCQDCEKEFKRPCDLTKHEKTHSRPWKCSEVNCKYHTYGWPTETERDRHVNDKHSPAPAMFACLYPPCTYKSKRESNCKQHMEKAHGYVYHRVKGQGKKTVRNATSQTPQTPQTTTPGPVSMGITPPMTRNPSQQNHQGPADQVNMVSGRSANANIDYDPMDDEFDYSTFDLNAFSHSPQGGYTSDDVSPGDLGPGSFGPSLPSSFNESQGFYGSGILHNAHNNQLLTPDLSHGRRPSGPFLHSPDQDVSGMFDPSPFQLNNQFSPDQDVGGMFHSSPLQPMDHLSPSGQGNVMFYSPNSNGVNQDDEGFVDFPHTTAPPTEDYTLYSSNPTLATTDGFFHEMSSLAGQTGHTNQQTFGFGDTEEQGYFTEMLDMGQRPELGVGSWNGD